MEINPDDVSLGLLIVRVVVGVTLASHGWAKVFTGGRLEGVGRWFDGMGMRPGKTHATLAASAEIGCGLLFAAGLLTPFAALGMVGVMSVAAYTSHKDNGFFIIKDGWEYVFVIATVAIAVATTGPGEYSLDNAIGLDISGVAGLAIALVGGIAAAGAQLGIFYRPPAPAAASDGADEAPPSAI